MGKLYDLKSLEELSGGDSGFIQQMCTIYIESVPENVKHFNEHLEDKDWDAIRGLAHKIKPTIDLLGIEKLKVEIRELKDLAEEEGDPGRIAELIGYVNQMMQEAAKEIETDL